MLRPAHYAAPAAATLLVVASPGAIAQPSIVITPTVADMGITFVPLIRTKDFTITNAGSSDWVLSRIDFYTLDNVSFAQSNTCSPAVPPGGSCTVTVDAALPVDVGTGNGDFFASMAISSNAPPASATLMAGRAVYGYRFTGPLNLSNNLIFPPTPLGSTRYATLTLENTGRGPISIAEIRLTRIGSGRFSLDRGRCPAVLPVGGSCPIEVSYTATREVLDETGVVRIAADVSGPTLFMGGNAARPDEDSDGDGVPNGIEAELATDPLVKDNDIFGDALLFAMQQYRDLLGRAPEAGGAAFWSSLLANGSMTRADLVSRFIASAEFEARVAPVARLYLGYFLRIPDHDGLAFWTARYRGGESIESISEAFAASPELRGRYGSLDDEQFVERVYRNVLGRAPDSGGLAFWRGELASISRGRMMIAFSESAEFRALTSNEVFVTMAYAGMLRRAPEPSGFAAWVGFLDAGNPREAMLQVILDSPEYRSRFLQ